MVYDVLIIGAGIIGSAVAYELSKYDLNICVCERFNDVGNGATKANSAVLHAGFDCSPSKRKARLNVEGARLAKEICKKLDVKRRELPSLVLAFNDADMKMLEVLYHRGIQNGVEDIKILTRQKAMEIEPNINPHIAGALYAPAAIVDPWEYAVAMSETASVNGVDFFFSERVEAIKKRELHFEVKTSKNNYKTRYIVNAAGAFGSDIYSLVKENKYVQTNRCGQYFVLDKSQSSIVNSIIFQCPTEKGKGVLVVPTVHGNLLVGPDSFSVENGDNVATTAEGLEEVKLAGLKSVPKIDFRQIIHEYAGVRPNCTIDDFIIEESKECRGFINLIGIQSPGLTAAPAVALECIGILKSSGLGLKKKNSYVDSRKHVRFQDLSNEEKERLIASEPSYGRIVCRCEKVTEGEIIEALNRPIVPKSLDAIKRRCGTGLGRCQGGFCGPRIHEIVSKHLGIAPEDVLLNQDGSYIVTGKIKGTIYES